MNAPPVPLLTGDLPGCGGLFKALPEDFEVEEVPAYLPSGEGQHLFLWVEKRGRGTPEVAKALARHFCVPERDVSYAGLKDRQALTRQLFCLPARAEALVPSFSDPDVRLLWWKRHRNKLKSGHLRANRFIVHLRDVRDAGAARAVLDRLVQTGVPNAFGDQRFGAADDNAELGKRLLLGNKLPRAPDRFQRRLYLSAYQSLLFNRALALRLGAGTLTRALPGDVLKKRDTGGEFVCTDPAADQSRVDRFEVSPAGPLFGPKMTPAGGEVAAAEGALLREEGLPLASFERGRGETEGARRPYRVPLEALELAAEGSGLRLAFTLPRGSYATVVLREVCK